MSVYSNSNGDNLLHAASWGVSTGNFSFGVWVKNINDRGTFVDYMSFGNTNNDPTDYVSLATVVDGTSLASYVTAGQIPSDTFDLGTGTWHWIVYSRSGSDATLRSFNDTTSTTPEFTSTATMSADLSALDNFVISQIFPGGTPEWADAEFANAKVHNGVAWSDAECRTESQNFEVQTAGGTVWGSWRLETISANSDGINDGSGNGRNLTNNGFVNGASRPNQLETIGGGGGGAAPPDLRRLARISTGYHLRGIMR